MLEIALRCSKNKCLIFLTTIRQLHPEINIPSLQITQQSEIHRFPSFQMTISFIKTYQRAILSALIIAQFIFI